MVRCSPCLVLLLMVCVLLANPATASERWVLVDTERKVLTVFDDDHKVRQFGRVAIGRSGTSTVRKRGDNTTPLGEFRIHRINNESRFHIFLGLDFPDFEHTRRAYAKGNLTIDQFLLVTDSLRRNQVPPQTTAMGGHIGIHGLGNGNADVHAVSDWTQGCIALTNEQIEEFAELVGIGTRVVVQ